MKFNYSSITLVVLSALSFSVDATLYFPSGTSAADYSSATVLAMPRAATVESTLNSSTQAGSLSTNAATLVKPSTSLPSSHLTPPIPSAVHLIAPQPHAAVIPTPPKPPVVTPQEVPAVVKEATTPESNRKSGLTPDEMKEFKTLAHANNCLACHSINRAIIGPAYLDVANKYRGADHDATQQELLRRISHGTSGRWGQNAMPANDAKEQKQEQLDKILHYILHLQ